MESLIHTYCPDLHQLEHPAPPGLVYHHPPGNRSPFEMPPDPYSNVKSPFGLVPRLRTWLVAL